MIDPAALGALALKAAVTAAIVVTASLIAERSKPVIAALVLSLPVSIGPTYVLLAMQHDARFIAEAALTSLPGNLATLALVLVYGWFARAGRGLVASLAPALGLWAIVSVAIPFAPWTITLAALALVIGYGAGIVATRSWRDVPAPGPAVRRWYDVPMRATLVAAVVVSVVTASEVIGPAATGVLALFPTAYSSFILLMHRRLGGERVTAALASGLVMLPGLILGVLFLHLMAAQGRVWWGIALFLGTPVVYSAAYLAWTRRRSS